MNMYDETKRIQGGSCFGDAMFRFTATPEAYAKKMVQRVLEKEWGGDSPFQYFGSEGYFIIVREDKPIIIKDYEFVENLRCEDVHGFEKWFLEIIRKTQ